MWKPTLSVAYQVRLAVMPPKARVATRAVLVAAPRAAPVLEQRQLLGRRLFDEVLGAVLVGQEVRALDGVVDVHLEAVVGRGTTAAAPPSAETVWLRIG